MKNKKTKGKAATTTTNTKTVVFITGAFVSHTGWSEWRKYFEAKGYKTVAPAWPHKDGTAEELRDLHPDDNPDLAGMTLQELIDHHVDIVAKLPEKPILIGHSTGGLLVQLLVNRGLAAAGVAIHPFPPQGVIPYEFSFLRAGWRALGFGSQRKTYLMSLPTWQYAFVNGMPYEEQKRAYDENVTPESKRLARGALTKLASVDFDKPHAPLLITAGDKDHIIPATLNRRNYDRYPQNSSVTEYKNFPGRNHFVLGQDTWREDADYIVEWLQKHVS